MNALGMWWVKMKSLNAQSVPTHKGSSTPNVGNFVLWLRNVALETSHYIVKVRMK